MLGYIGPMVAAKIHHRGVAGSSRQQKRLQLTVYSLHSRPDDLDEP